MILVHEIRMYEHEYFEFAFVTIKCNGHIDELIRIINILKLSRIIHG
jgi:hypothetical protein